MKLETDRIVGNYRVVRPLGSGGMGSVYEVEHVRLGIRRALKVFSAEGKDVDFLRKRFLAEGKILARLDHPRIVRVHDMDVTDGFAWFVMDYVEGPDGAPQTLGDVPRAGLLPETKIAGWYADVREALSAVHAAGVIHRDVKLENILVGRDGRAVLSDFGISRISNDRLRRELEVTRTMVGRDADAKTVVGTAAYLAPEIRKGADPTAAVDHYALGIAFFRLLTGMWYEPGPHAFDLLVPFDRRWRSLFAALLAEDTARRSLPDLTIGRRRRWPTHVLCVLFSAILSALAAVLAVRWWQAPPRSEPAAGEKFEATVEQVFSIPASVE